MKLSINVTSFFRLLTSESVNDMRRETIIALFSTPTHRGPFPCEGRYTCRRRKLFSILSIGLVITVVLGVIIWYLILVALIARLRPPPTPNNGLRAIISNWVEPGSVATQPASWFPRFSRDITPIACHSHNDYERDIPLFDALQVGCTSVEADIWLEDSELYVSHHKSQIKPNRTLKTLYINPLLEILKNQNLPATFPDTSEDIRPQGVFDKAPNTTLVLLVDFKTDGEETFPYLMKQLEPLRQAGWLSYYDSATLSRVARPITVVGTGNTPFSFIATNQTTDIFFDAPLASLESTDLYNTTNSYYASVSIKKAVGHIWSWGLSSKQIKTIKTQIQMAKNAGLIARYWDTPSWPVGLKLSIWRILEEEDVGVLNVDDLVTATRWNWKFCTILGLQLC
ncbi:hypothetical protein BP5796_06988 [Coleophoma crateriformis]|uniref:Altered inheritance of mitochondria protein 6 n=1 Tax=Coleophoma crateriformis TaxID=565419 RepID=A0A3D8RQ10_9HELO|nr:hypothetical protein BP5796_06988 [Coleophoma crateriformis]